MSALQRPLVMVLVGLAGCTSCKATPDRDTGVDAHTDVVSEDIRVPRDNGVVPPFWSDGGEIAQPYRLDAQVQFDWSCGQAEPLFPVNYWEAHRSCRAGDWWYNWAGYTGRLSLSGRYLESINEQWGVNYKPGCAAGKMYFGVSHKAANSVAILQTDPDMRSPRVLWQYNSPFEDRAEDIPPEVHYLVVTDQFLGWLWFSGITGYHLLLSDLQGQNVRDVPFWRPGSGAVTDVSGSGNRLVYRYQGDIWLVTYPDNLENLTNDRFDQWHPWIDGDRVVWVDQRNGPGWSGAPNNPEIYMMDLRTRETTRITNDRPDRPVGQQFPVVKGDWVVWTDFRNAAVPNPPEAFTDRTEIWGYHIPTQREVPLVTGNILATYPTFLDEQTIGVQCPSPRDYMGLFTLKLPQNP